MNDMCSPTGSRTGAVDVERNGVVPRSHEAHLAPHRRRQSRLNALVEAADPERAWTGRRRRQSACARRAVGRRTRAAGGRQGRDAGGRAGVFGWQSRFAGGRDDRRDGGVEAAGRRGDRAGPDERAGNGQRGRVEQQSLRPHEQPVRPVEDTRGQQRRVGRACRRRRRRAQRRFRWRAAASGSRATTPASPG